MSRHSEYESKTEELLRPIVAECGVEIYDIEYVKEGADFYLRAYIDKEGGVNIDDCENVSRRLSDALDAADFIPDAYILEVSSPGLGRKLTKDRHLDRSIGDEVDIRFYKPPDGFKTKELSGTLDGYDAEKIFVIMDGERTGFDRKAIAQIRLAFDF
ncbi:ribosome maturation factor RimP [Lachnospiraceae bacterium XBB2008]|nr:ribosome maturation factor RimP [Lachnospiraceae bacterium XBB2008]